MIQTSTTARPSPGASSREMQSALDQLALAQLRVTDLEVRLGQFSTQAQHVSGAERARLTQQWAQAKAEYAVANGELASADQRVNRLIRGQQGLAPASTPPIARTGPTTGPTITTTVPPFQMPEISDGVALGGTLLLLPLMIALARRIWTRGGPRAVAPDLDLSPRLQRIEQAIESIAVEVERIGEAQRFTTKMLAERPQEAGVGRPPLVPTSRQAPGTITPH